MCGAWNQIVHRISSLAADPADADDAQCFGSDRSKLIQLMLMMRGAWDKIGRNMMRVLGIRLLKWLTANPADADDARCLGSDRSQLIQLMLMMRSALGSDGSQMCGAWDQILHRTSSHAADPADADDAQCLGSDRSKLFQLMLMMRGAWDQIGRS